MSALVLAQTSQSAQLNGKQKGEFKTHLTCAAPATVSKLNQNLLARISANSEIAANS